MQWHPITWQATNFNLQLLPRAQGQAGTQSVENKCILCFFLTFHQKSSLHRRETWLHREAFLFLTSSFLEKRHSLLLLPRHNAGFYRPVLPPLSLINNLLKWRFSLLSICSFYFLFLLEMGRNRDPEHRIWVMESNPNVYREGFYQLCFLIISNILFTFLIPIVKSWVDISTELPKSKHSFLTSNNQHKAPHFFNVFAIF